MSRITLVKATATCRGTLVNTVFENFHDTNTTSTLFFRYHYDSSKLC